MITHNLFVYGTLQPEQANNYILEEIGGSFVKATLFGYDFDRIWQKQTGYPGIIYKKSDCKVEGHLFTSKNLMNFWVDIDNFETKAYKRIPVSVLQKDDIKTEAYVYIINKNFNLTNF